MLLKMLADYAFCPVFVLFMGVYARLIEGYRKGEDIHGAARVLARRIQCYHGQGTVQFCQSNFLYSCKPAFLCIFRSYPADVLPQPCQPVVAGSLRLHIKAFSLRHLPRKSVMQNKATELCYTVFYRREYIPTHQYILTSKIHLSLQILTYIAYIIVGGSCSTTCQRYCMSKKSPQI